MSPAHINNKMAVAKKKQWQRYIDDSLMKTNQVSMAAIHALDGTQWASSDELQVTKEQIQRLVACITGDSTLLKRSGIKVANQNFILLRCDPQRSIYGRMGADSGVCIVKTNRALLIGVYGAGMQPGNCNAVMEKLADYLIENGI